MAASDRDMKAIIDGLPKFTGHREFQWPGETPLGIYFKYEHFHSKDIVSLKAEYPLNSMMALEAVIKSAEKFIRECLEVRIRKLNTDRPILRTHAVWVIGATKGYTVRQVSERAKIPQARAQRLLTGKAKLCSSDIDNIVEGFRVSPPTPEFLAAFEREALIYEQAKQFNIHKGAVKREHTKRNR